MSNKKLAYEIEKEAKEMEDWAAADPDNYFAEAWLEGAKKLRAEAKISHIQEREALEGKTYNTLLDDWE
jgi:hypothetical protein